MSTPKADAPIDYGPRDAYHPIYDSVVEWLDGERQTKLDSVSKNQRRTPTPTKGKGRAGGAR